MESRGTLFLRKIVDGSVLKELIEYSELDNRIEGFTPRLRKVLKTIIDQNKMSKLPKRNDLVKLTRLSPSAVYTSLAELKENDLIHGPTSVEFYKVFADPRFYKLSPPLDRIIEEKYSTPWKKRLESTNSPAHPRYFIASVTEEGRPVFIEPFKKYLSLFLDY